MKFTCKKIAALALLSFGFTQAAFANECVINNGGYNVDVFWYHPDNSMDNNASKTDVPTGKSVCQNNAEAGYAIVNIQAGKSNQRVQPGKGQNCEMAGTTFHPTFSKHCNH